MDENMRRLAELVGEALAEKWMKVLRAKRVEQKTRTAKAAASSVGKRRQGGRR